MWSVQRNTITQKVPRSFCRRRCLHMNTPGDHFRQLLDTARKESRAVAVPGVFCGLAARLAKEKGFEAGYVSGGALSASSGVPDIGVLTLDHFTSKIKEIGRVSALPLLCDADTGFGEEENVVRTTIEYIDAGAAAMHLEDQVFPKRCGHLSGKSLIPADDMCRKVQAAVAAKSSRHSKDPSFIVCARTDAFSVGGMGEAVDRARRYVAAGAEMIFPEGLASRDDFKEFAEAMHSCTTSSNTSLYLMANMTEFGQTDHISVHEFRELGYDLVVFPVTTLRVAMKAVDTILEVIMNEGTVEGHLETMLPRDEMYRVLQYDPSGDSWTYPSAS